MDYTILTIIIILAAIGVYELLKRAYKFLIYQFNRILSLETQGKFNATHFNKIRNDIADMDRYHGNISKEIREFADRLTDIEEADFSAKDDKLKHTLGLAFRRIAKLEENKLPVDNSFKHFVDDKFKKLEGTLKVHHVSLKGLDVVQLIHARSISALEKVKK